MRSDGRSPGENLIVAHGKASVRDQMTVWSIFPGNTKYFEPSQASFMVNYIVDDLEVLLDRLAKEGVRIDPKRQDESYGRFAWIYDPDGNKIELWQPLQQQQS